MIFTRLFFTTSELRRRRRRRPARNLLRACSPAIMSPTVECHAREGSFFSAHRLRRNFTRALLHVHRNHASSDNCSCSCECPSTSRSNLDFKRAPRRKRNSGFKCAQGRRGFDFISETITPSNCRIININPTVSHIRYASRKNAPSKGYLSLLNAPHRFCVQT